MIAELIELTVRIWRADSQMLENSVVGESELDKQSRRLMAWLCGGVTVMLILVGIAWVVLTR